MTAPAAGNNPLLRIEREEEDSFLLLSPFSKQENRLRLRRSIELSSNIAREESFTLTSFPPPIAHAERASVRGRKAESARARRAPLPSSPEKSSRPPVGWSLMGSCARRGGAGAVLLCSCSMTFINRVIIPQEGASLVVCVVEIKLRVSVISSQLVLSGPVSSSQAVRHRLHLSARTLISLSGSAPPTVSVLHFLIKLTFFRSVCHLSNSRVIPSRLLSLQNFRYLFFQISRILYPGTPFHLFSNFFFLLFLPCFILLSCAAFGP